MTPSQSQGKYNPFKLPLAHQCCMQELQIGGCESPVTCLCIRMVSLQRYRLCTALYRLSWCFCCPTSTSDVTVGSEVTVQRSNEQGVEHGDRNRSLKFVDSVAARPRAAAEADASKPRTLHVEVIFVQMECLWGSDHRRCRSSDADAPYSCSSAVHATVSSLYSRPLGVQASSAGLSSGDDSFALARLCEALCLLFCTHASFDDRCRRSMHVHTYSCFTAVSRSSSRPS